MKRLTLSILILSLLISGCAFGGDGLKEPVTFYYLRDHSTPEGYDAFFTEGAIGSENREAAGHRQDLTYLLKLYLQGPLDSDLKSPFPVASKITDIQQKDRTLTVTMNAVPSRYNDMDLTISCACLARTCMGLVDVDTVTIQAFTTDGKTLFTRSFTHDDLIAEDLYSQNTEEPSNGGNQ